MKAAERDQFRRYLRETGVSTSTIGDYVRDVESAQKAGGFVERLLDDRLAPKTRRRALAAARRWADFTEDQALVTKLRRLKLPAAQRKAAKTPLTKAQLLDLVAELDRCDYLPASTVSVLGMMACRGLRCGDVLRITRGELVAAKAGILAFEGKGNKRLEFPVIKTYRRFLTKLADHPGDWDRVEDLVAARSQKNARRAAAKTIARALVKVGVRCGIYGGLHPHRLRRTYAVEYLRAQKGDPEGILRLKEHMQWSSVDVAMEYVNHARGDELSRVAESIFDDDLDNVE